MEDGRPENRPDGVQSTARPVESLANRALSVLAARRGGRLSKPSETFLLRLRDAVLDEDHDRRLRILDLMRETQISDDAIHDHYIPEVARRIGADWVADRLSFAEVTIGAARLQSLLRELSPEDPGADSDAPGIAVMTPPGEDHTLGASVLAGQLRRAGADVRVLAGETSAQLLAGLGGGRFDAVFISVATGQALANLHKFVNAVRSVAGPDTSIVIGGPAVEREQNARKRTGADFASSDATDALKLCGLRASPRTRRAGPKEG